MTYLWLKALHLAAVLAWSGGLLLLGVAAASLGRSGGVLLPHEKRMGQAFLRWDRRVTVPAMLAVWGLGIALASLGGWFGAGWLYAKLVLVFALSGLHGVLSAFLRRRIEGAGIRERAWIRVGPGLCVAAFGAIALLVVLKP